MITALKLKKKEAATGKTLYLARNGVTVSSPFITALELKHMEAAMGKTPNVCLAGNGETVSSATFTALELEKMEDSGRILRIYNPACRK